MCETDVDECLTNATCMHGGVCENLHGDHQCLCQKGYEGVFFLFFLWNVVNN